MSVKGATATTVERKNGAMASAALLSTVGIGAQGVSRLIYTVLIGRTFGTEALGHASTLLSLSIFVALLWPTAAGNTASRFLALALHRRVSDAALVRVLGRTMLASSLLLGVATVPVAMALGNSPLVAVSAAGLVVGYGLYAYARGGRLGRHGAARVALWDSVSAAGALGLLIVVCLTGQGTWVLVPLTVGYLVFAVACLPRGNRLAGPELEVSPVLGFARWNVVAGLTTNGLLQLAMISAQVWAPGDAAGFFAAAFTLATPASMLGQAVSQIVIPAFAHRATSSSLRHRGPLSLFLAFAGGSALLFGAMVLLAPWYLPLFYPTEGDAAVPLLRFLMLGVYVFTVALIPAALMLAAGRSREVALSSVAGFVAGVTVMVASGPTAGVSSGSIGFLVGSTVNLVVVVLLSVGRRPSASSPDVDQSSERATLQ
ncbi:hypothetical protein IFT36_01545 [Frigoribacterium sp. CFBP 13605]|uniref:lipopolysaccharide biosynthesis protein n=1 Tax=Frigoribacterium sp. CFBP 13605 TaxID=2774034 RepID=UPI001902F485|nr:hypothetical protein [Frigoribacterium sp. CFBP 13605]MBD8139228.1 hypothetical protein [Frigoribacterium sp. CFBP 13605]